MAGREGEPGGLPPEVGLPPFQIAFVSYVSEDWDAISRLCGDLRDAGIDVWLDKPKLRGQGGARWEDRIRAAIDEADFFIACFSDAYWRKAKNTFMNREIKWARARFAEMPPEMQWFIPVRLSDCHVPAFPTDRVKEETLCQLERIDLFEDWKGGVQRLIASIAQETSIPRDIEAPRGSRGPGGPGALKPPDFAAVCEDLLSEDWAVRAAAARSVREQDDQTCGLYIEYLAEELGNQQTPLRQVAAASLGYIRDRRAVGPLVSALADQARRVRANAAHALGTIGDPAAVDFLVDVIRDDRAWQVQAHAARALGMIRTGVPTAPLIEALGHEQQEVRAKGAWALGELEDRRALASLTALLGTDPSHIVRGEAAAALGKIGGQDALKALVTALPCDESRAVRVQIAQALGEIGDLAAVPALTAVLQGEDDLVGSAAARALTRIGGKEAVGALVGALEHDDDGIRTVAAGLLGQIRDKAAVQPLARALGDRHEGVRAAAGFALGQIGDPAAVPALTQALKDGLGEAAEALRKIGTPEALEALKEYGYPVREGDESGE